MVIRWIRFLTLCLLSTCVYAQSVYEIDASPYGTKGAPVPEYIRSQGEKFILVDPNQHAWGAYSSKGKLIRWGIATTGAEWCSDTASNCRTKTGSFRIYSLGDGGCFSSKFPIPGGGAPMPYCMYFDGSQAIHGSNNVEFGNASHGCVRVHVADAKWLRYQFVDGPSKNNNFRGTLVIVRPYGTTIMTSVNFTQRLLVGLVQKIQN